MHTTMTTVKRNRATTNYEVVCRGACVNMYYAHAVVWRELFIRDSYKVLNAGVPTPIKGASPFNNTRRTLLQRLGCLT
jgi:hypothetical protein